MVKPPANTPGEKDNSGSVSANTVDILGSVTSLAAGVVAGILYMEEKVYQNFSVLGGFERIKHHGNKEYEQLETNRASGVLDRKSMFEEINKLMDKKNLEAGKAMDAAGIHTLGEHWRVLRPYQKMQTMAFGAAAASVTLGAVLTIAQRISERHREEKESGGPTP